MMMRERFEKVDGERERTKVSMSGEDRAEDKDRGQL